MLKVTVQSAWYLYLLEVDRLKRAFTHRKARSVEDSTVYLAVGAEYFPMRGVAKLPTDGELGFRPADTRK